MADEIVIAGLKEQRDYMAELRDEYRSGHRKIGIIKDGMNIDQTEQEITDLNRRIENLDRVLAAYEKQDAKRS
ncbi:phosphopantetheine adenylyltransferase [Bradyrhizobium yuanmingense]|uniref:hypothetical protein n=1 Tax=Bradyrhizobium yuanmingense TaxID=108015 RepID=UPI00351738F8